MHKQWRGRYIIGHGWLDLRSYSIIVLHGGIVVVENLTYLIIYFIFLYV